jgi:uncharacterized membrane protein
MDREADEPSVGDLIDELEQLEAVVDDEAERERVRETIETAENLDTRRVFGQVIVGFDRSDVAEALLGSVVFGIPMLVEGGTQDVGAFLATHPAYSVGTVAFTVLVVVGIVYVADFQDVRVRDPILGVVPRRLVGVLGVAAVTAVVGMTAWGRVDWSDPVLAGSQATVCFVAMAIGAALGDILPGT